jgi:ABC-type lipoprotein export system ATPase subunit
VVSDVSLSFPKRGLILDHVSFRVEPGDTVALVGASGSGKTSLLAIIGGLLPARSGSVSLLPTELGLVPSAVAAWITQTTNALMRRSARDNVALGLLACGFEPHEAMSLAPAHLEAVGLAGRVDARCGELSGGELQRVAVARALSLGAPLVLADEPTGQLDRTTSDQIVSLLLDGPLQQDGRMTIVATHDEQLAARCQRVLRLDDGRLVEKG